MRVVTDSISKTELAEMAKRQFGELVKAVVDVEKEIMAVGGEMHADEEALLLEGGSRQEDLWGVNIYPQNSGEDWIEFDSVINIRPPQGNRSRNVENPIIRAKIKEIITKRVSH
jgi:hypothetical protein